MSRMWVHVFPFGSRGYEYWTRQDQINYEIMYSNTIKRVY